LEVHSPPHPSYNYNSSSPQQTNLLKPTITPTVTHPSSPINHTSFSSPPFALLTTPYRLTNKTYSSLSTNHHVPPVSPQLTTLHTQQPLTFFLGGVSWAHHSPGDSRQPQSFTYLTPTLR
jgi:hypothetical protein